MAEEQLDARYWINQVGFAVVFSIVVVVVRDYLGLPRSSAYVFIFGWLMGRLSFRLAKYYADSKKSKP